MNLANRAEFTKSDAKFHGAGKTSSKNAILGQLGGHEKISDPRQNHALNSCLIKCIFSTNDKNMRKVRAWRRNIAVNLCSSTGNII